MKKQRQRKAIILLIAGMLFLFVSPFFAGTTVVKAEETGPDPNFHIYLAFGQSNMTGVGVIEEQDKTCDDDFLVMCTSNLYQTEKNPQRRILGNWYKATPPLSESAYGGLSLSDYFGRTMLEMKKKEDPNIKVGILVVDVPGVGIRMFDQDAFASYWESLSPAAVGFLKPVVDNYGGNPYQRLVGCGRIAQKSGVIKGIIMHQGESDNQVPGWRYEVVKIYHDLVRDLNLDPDIPFVAGEVRNGTDCSEMNQVINILPEAGSQFYVISSDDLTDTAVNPGDVHFVSEEYRAFGRRYAETMYEAEKVKAVSEGQTTVSGNEGQVGVPDGQTTEVQNEQQKKPAEPTVSGQQEETVPGTEVKPAGYVEASDDAKMGRYRITEVAEGAAATYLGPVDKDVKRITVPSKVRINGTLYQVTAIGKQAFSGCRRLQSITIPDGILRFEESCFAKTPKLKRISFRSQKLKAAYFHKKTFRGLKASVSIKVPKTKVKAYKTLFRKKGLRKKIRVLK